MNPSTPTGKPAPQTPKLSGGSPKRDINLLSANANTAKIAKTGTVILAAVVGLGLFALLAIVLPLGSLNALRELAASTENQLSGLQHINSEVMALYEQRKALTEMLAAIDDSGESYIHPDDIVSMLTTACPSKITLLSLTCTKGDLTITGVSAANPDVAQFISNLRTQPMVTGVSLDSVIDSPEEEQGAAKARIFKLVIRLTTAARYAPTAEPGAPDATAAAGQGGAAQ